MKPAAMAILFSSALACSCGSFVHGTSAEVEIVSLPSGATVFDHGQEVGVTPTRLKLSRSPPHHDLTFKLDGYQVQQARTEREASAWFWGNLLWGPLFPVAMLADAAAGGAYDVSPTSLSVVFLKQTESR